MKESELKGTAQPSDDMPMVVTTDTGELLWVSGDGSNTADLADSGAEIVVMETEDGQQQIQLVTGDGGQVLSLPPELASRLKENLSGLVAGEGVQRDEEEEGEEQVEEETVELQDGAVELLEAMPEGSVVLQEGEIELPEGAVILPEGAVISADGVVELPEGAIELQDGMVELQDGTVELQDGMVELQDGMVELQDEAVELQDETVELQDGTVVLQDGTVELQDEVVELQDGTVVLRDGTVELQDEVVELQDGTVVLQDGTVELRDETDLQDGMVVLQDETVELQDGTVELQDGHDLEDVYRKVAVLVTDSADEDTREATEVASDPTEMEKTKGILPAKASTKSQPSEGSLDLQPPVEVVVNPDAAGGNNSAREEPNDDNGKRVQDDIEVPNLKSDLMKEEEETAASNDENIDAVAYATEEIGEFLVDMGFNSATDGVKVRQAQKGDADMTEEAGEDGQAEWTESTITSASGTRVTIRLPTAQALLSHAASSATPSEAPASDPPRPAYRLISTRPSGLGPPFRPPHVLHVRKKKFSADDEAWAARTRRRASRGIARAVAAVRRAEDSDSFDSDDGEKVMVSASDQPKRGRGRPRKPGGFSCQLCPRRLETQAAFFQHLRDHYEKLEGEEGETVAAEEAGEDVEMENEQIPEECDDRKENVPATINVDIIAEDTTEEFVCEQCDEGFFSNDELERHRKIHIREAIKAEGESSGPESEAETVPDDLGTDTDNIAHLVSLSVKSEPPPADVDPELTQQYEIKNLKKCGDCPKLFTTIASLKSHRLRMHNLDGTPISITHASKHEYECDECHVTYTSHKIYERHKRLHMDKAAGRLPHRCSSCGLSFLTSNLLAHHALREHPETCKERPSVFGPKRPNGRPQGSSNKDRQAVYDMIKEEGEGRFVCSLCGKEAPTKNQMFYHISIKHHALEGRRCPTCGKSFFTESALKIHERVHTGERPYGCEICPRRFRQLADLNSHIKSQHTMEKPYRCRFCGKSFCRKYSLTIHLRCHTNERNYICPVCNKGFRASTYLTGHMKIHTGEKSHSCPICQKAFRMPSDMKRHIFTHAREKPPLRSLRALSTAGQQGDKELFRIHKVIRGDKKSRSCPICHKAFRSHAEMTHHVISHAGEKQLSGPLTVAGEQGEGVVLLDPSQLGFQVLTGEEGESMLITDGDQNLIIDGSETAIQDATGQIIVPKSAISELDETAVASMYLLAEGQSEETMELT